MATENPAIPEKLITFYRFIPTARKPIRADASAGGTIPTRSFRYCEPIRTASSFGWYFFPPMDFGLLWDGSDVLWSHAGQPEWKPLARQHFPNFSKHFDEKSPADCKGYAVPFLGSMPEPGIVNIWSGWVARSAPGWNVLIRPVANLPQPGGWENFEGVVETDRWFGPLFVNIRLRRTGVPILVRRELPLFQAQPLPRWLFSDKLLNAFDMVGGLEDLTEADWQAYRETVVLPQSKVNRKLGDYAKRTRKRGKNDTESGSGQPEGD